MSSQYDGVLPESGDLPGALSVNDADDAQFISDVNAKLNEYIDAMDHVKIRRGLQIVMETSMLGNGYLQSSGLGKALMTENPTRCAQVLSRAMNLIYVLSTLIHPFMPAISDSLLSQLNAPARTVPNVFSTDILAGHTIGKPDHLFKRIDDAKVDEFKARFGGLPEEEAAPEPKAKKGKKGKAATPSIPNGPKTPEVEALEAKIDAQGSLVRSLKAQPKTSEVETQIKQHVDTLKALKAELVALQSSA